ncbi:MAG: hypothetical protein M3332_17730, partial [Actinomycetota bacterium]|nr:hypothetical protein [Actinomycetota bacterium]
GLTWAAIRGRVVAKGVPEQAMGAVESSVPLAQKIQSEGIGGVWEQLKAKVGDLKKTLLGKIAQYLIPTVIIAGITWLISLLNPASAFIKACKAIIDIVMFIVERGAQIMAFVNAVLDAVIAIAGGGAGGVPGLIEAALVTAIPVLIGFLAALLGIGGLADKVKKLFQSLSKPVMKAVDWIVDKIVAFGKKLWAKLKAKFGKKSDKRTEQEKTRALADAERAADTEMVKPGATPQSVAAVLPRIKSRFKLAEITLVPAGQSKFKTHLKVNPEADTPERNLGGPVEATEGFSMSGEPHTLNAVLQSKRLQIRMASTPGDLTAKANAARTDLQKAGNNDAVNAIQEFSQKYAERITNLENAALQEENKKQALEQLLREMAADLVGIGTRFKLKDLGSYTALGLSEIELNRMVYDALGQARNQILAQRERTGSTEPNENEELQERFDRLMHAAARAYRGASGAHLPAGGNALQFRGNVFSFAGGTYFVDHQHNYIVPDQLVGNNRGSLGGKVFVASRRVLRDLSELDSDPARSIIDRFAYTSHRHTGGRFADLARLAALGGPLEPVAGTMFLAAMIAEAERNPNAHVTNLLLLGEGGSERFYDEAPMTKGGTDSPTAPRDPTLSDLSTVVRQRRTEVTDAEIAMIRRRFEGAEGMPLGEVAAMLGANETKAELVKFLVRAAGRL